MKLISHPLQVVGPDAESTHCHSHEGAREAGLNTSSKSLQSVLPHCKCSGNNQDPGFRPHDHIYLYLYLSTSIYIYIYHMSDRTEEILCVSILEPTMFYLCKIFRSRLGSRFERIRWLHNVWQVVLLKHMFCQRSREVVVLNQMFCVNIWQVVLF